MLGIDLPNMFRKKLLVHPYCHLTYGLTTCALDFLLFCRSCLGALVLGEMILLTIRPFLLVNRRLGFYGATLTVREITPSPPTVYLWI